MNENEIYLKVQDALVKTLGVKKEEIAPEKLLIDNLGMQSLDLLDIFFQIEKVFDIKIPRRELEEKAKGELSQEEFSSEGLITELGKKQLAHNLPAIDVQRLERDISPEEIPELLTVRTIVLLIKEKIDNK